MFNPEKAILGNKSIEAKMEQIREAINASMFENSEGTGVFFTNESDASKLAKLMKNFLNTN